ncbi:hypothetical protein F2Q70_00010986, partial [Brassica cretica]
VKANAGALTNFEVLDLINSKGASKITTRVIAAIARSKYKIIEEPKEWGIDTDGILELVQDFLPPLPVVETQMEKDQDETNNGEES